MVNWIQILFAVLPELIQLAPKVVSAWNSTASNNGLAKITAVVRQTSIANVLAEIGAAEFPNLAPELHAAAAALAHLHSDNTAYAQDALNIIASTGYIKLDAPLVVDGKWGPKTKAAVVALQAKLGLPINGFLADAEYTAINALLAKV